MKKRNIYYQLSEICTSLYLIIMFGVFPLYFQNNYLNMLAAKTTFFKSATSIYLVLGVVSIWLVSIFRAEEYRKSKKKIKTNVNTKRELSLENKFFIVFLSALVISTLFSGDIKNAWESPDCKMYGTLIMLLCCGAYLMVSKGYMATKSMKISLIFGIGTVSILAVLNRYGIDPLNMYSNIVEEQKPIYISTIGNVNILSSFICIFMPLFFGHMLYARNRKEKIVYGIMAYLSCMAGISTNSDSFFLGFGVTMIFFLWYAFEGRDSMKKYLYLCLICAFSFASLELCNLISTFEYKWYTLQKYLIYKIPWGLVILVLFGILQGMKLLDEKYYKKIRNTIFMIFAIIMIGLIGYIVTVNLNNTDKQASMFILTDSWGTNRGFVWKRTLELYRELPFVKKLIGVGPGGFKEFFAIYNAQRASMGTTVFADPHSEFLYYLVSTGFFGMVGYFGMIIASIKACLKKNSRNTIILASVFLSWIAQGTVNNPLVFTTPYLFIFMGMSAYETRNKVC